MSMKTFITTLIFVAVSVPLSLGAEADVGASEFAVLKARVAEQRQQLLWVERARHRPQPGARAPRQDHRIDHVALSHGMVNQALPD